MLRFLLTLARHLDLVGEHALGYAELVRAECVGSLRSWIAHFVAFALAALFVLIGLVSSAVVLALWSNGIDVSSWRAWAVPIACLIAALGCVIFALARNKPPPMFDLLTQQLQRDIDLLRAARGEADANGETRERRA